MGIFNWGLTDKEKAINKIQADYRAKNDGQPMDNDKAIQVYMNSLDKNGKVSPAKVDKIIQDFSDLPKFDAPMSNFDYGQDGLPPQLEAVRTQNEIDATVESQMAGSPSVQRSAFGNLPRQGFGNVVRPLDERLTVGSEPMQRGMDPMSNEILGELSQEVGYEPALKIMKDNYQNENMDAYLNEEGGDYGTADSGMVETPIRESAFAGEPMSQMDGDFGGMDEPTPNEPRAITPEYIAEVSSKGGSFMADGSVVYPDAPVQTDRMKKIIANRAVEADIAEKNRLAAIAFDKSFAETDSTKQYPKGTVIGGVMGTGADANIDENGVITPKVSKSTPSAPRENMSRQERIRRMNNPAPEAKAPKTKTKAKKPAVNPKTGKNTVKVPKSPYTAPNTAKKAPVVTNGERAASAKAARMAKAIQPKLNPVQASAKRFAGSQPAAISAYNIMNADDDLEGRGTSW